MRIKIKSISLILLAILLMILLSSCTAGDNIGTDVYVQNVYPANTNYNLGSSILKWNAGYFHELHVDASTLYIGGVSIVADNSTLYVAGKPIIASSGNITLPISQSDVTNLVTDLGNRELTSNKGLLGGYAGLDLGARVPTVNLGSGTANATTFLRGDQSWAIPTASATWGSITGTLSSQSDIQSALNGKLSSITGTNLDNVFSSNGLLKRIGAGSYTVDPNVYLTSFTETDPIFSGSASYSITSANITSWNNKLSSYSETDPVFGASAAYGISGSDISNWNGKLSSITGTALDGVFASNGLLKRTGSGSYTVDANTYLTSFTELDPVFSGSVAYGISSGDISSWNGKLSSVTVDSPLSGSGTSGSHLTVDLSSKQNTSAILTALAGLSYGSGTPFVKMTGASSFSLDPSTYLTTVSSSNLDNVFSTTGLLKRTGTATYTTDTSTYLTNITTSTPTNGTGFLKGNGSVISFDNSTYISSISTSTATSGTGFLKGNGSVISFDNSTYVTSSVSTLSSLASIGTITTGTWNGALIIGTYGGTGVNNGTRTITLSNGNITLAPPAAGATITLANNFTTAGNYALTLTQTNTTSVTLPTTGTLATLLGTESLAAKTIVEASNVFPKTTVLAANTAGVMTFTAAQLIGGLIVRTAMGAARSDVTDTAANIIAAIPNYVVGTSFEFRILNQTATYTETLTAGSGVTITGTATTATLCYHIYLAVITSASAVQIYSLGTGTY